MTQKAFAYIKKRPGGEKMEHRGLFSNLETKVYGRNVAFLSDIDSTNNYIKRLEKYLPDGFVAIAEKQENGRGRSGKSFYSPTGHGLYMSILLKDVKAVSDSLATVKACLAVCRAIDGITGTGRENGVGIKWVNDIYYDGKKLCGILCERVQGSDGEMYVVIGIGVNLFFDIGEAPKEIRNIAGSVFDICGVQYDALTLCAKITNELEKLFCENVCAKEIIEQYKSRSVVLGREISVIQGEETKRAAALDICEDGLLLVRYEDGFTAKLCGGEVSIRQR